MVFHTNDGKSTTKIFLKNFTFPWDVSVYECGLIDISVLEELTVVIINTCGSNELYVFHFKVLSKAI